MEPPYRPLYQLCHRYKKLFEFFIALPTYGIIGQFTDPPSPRHVFECLAVASLPNTRRAEDPIA